MGFKGAMPDLVIARSADDQHGVSEPLSSTPLSPHSRRMTETPQRLLPPCATPYLERRRLQAFSLELVDQLQQPGMHRRIAFHPPQLLWVALPTIRPGTPATKEPSGTIMPWPTTAPAAMMQRSPISDSCRTVAFIPISTWLPIRRELTTAPCPRVTRCQSPSPSGHRAAPRCLLSGHRRRSLSGRSPPSPPPPGNAAHLSPITTSPMM